MPITYRALAVLLLAAPALRAQPTGPRVAIAPELFYMTPATIYDHLYEFPPLPGIVTTRLEQLTVRGAAAAGGALTVRLRGRYSLVAQGAAGASRYRYHERNVAPSPTTGEPTVTYEAVLRGHASVTTAALGVARRLGGVGRTSADLIAGASVHRLAIRREPPCLDLGCVEREPPRWQRSYQVPGAVVGVRARHALTSHLTLVTGAMYSLGRADTRAFSAAMPTELQPYAGPASSWVQAGQLSVGVSVEL
jgi:hypothetical protein